MRKFSFSKFVTNFADNFGFSRGVAISILLVFSGVLIFAFTLFFYSAPPTTLIISSGPPGSLFETNAQKYAAILAKNGVKLKVLDSNGSLENLERLENPRYHVDLGFVQGGVTNNASASGLMSLGSLFYEPMWIFYRADKPMNYLSELEGKRIAIGPVGSGTRTLALTLITTNGISTNGPTALLDMEADPASKALLSSNIDAVFFMADSASSQTLRSLLRSPLVRLYDFKQADGYSRRIRYLNKLEVPMGSFDFGKNLPADNVHLVAPTVELIARNNLHPALSDLLLEAAVQVHGNATMLQKQGEFPAMIEHNYPPSEDATRYYKSGKSGLYRTLPYWLASMLNRVLVIFIPMIVVLIPGLKLIPTVYRWRMRLRIQRWYRALLVLEQDIAESLTPAKRDDVLRRLDEIEKAVNRMKLPASFGDQFYGLRGHISFVRDRLRNNLNPS